jgi:hypothetical protein
VDESTAAAFLAAMEGYRIRRHKDALGTLASESTDGA